MKTEKKERTVCFKGALIALAGSVLFAGPSPASAQQPQLSDAHAIVERIIERDPSLRSFQARVHVDVRLLSFPFVSPKLDGTSYFKRPNDYEVIFDNVPGYAKGFKKMFADIGDPASWERDCDVEDDGARFVDGRRLLALRMTKKVHSTILDDAVAYIDPTSYETLQMEWHYKSGGKIVMTQEYKTVGPYTVIAAQHVEIAIPHVRAVADATYGQYQTNVSIDQAVFAAK
ncbi:MAG: hypothetical protein GIW99_03025 [Candidatus Eremiobacteraeota bacterium]|nr:hypothetical protein [Candidatus Eremiobacteraeota bacterium]MBC5826645.1 hypothetical protein [Candidatus Eremiobacteraeota bacterium]